MVCKIAHRRVDSTLIYRGIDAKLGKGGFSLAQTNLNGAVADRPAKKKTARRSPTPGGRRAPFDYDEGRQTFQRDSVFWEWLAGYPKTEGLSLYVFRIAPSIDNAQVGRTESNIGLITDPAKWNREYIQESYGGGVLMLKLSDANARPTERARTWVKNDDPEVEPKLDLRTLRLNDPVNADYIERCIVRGLLVRGEDGKPRLKTEPAAAPAVAAAAPPASAPASAGGAISVDGAAPDNVFASLPSAFWARVMERLISPPPSPLEQLKVLRELQALASNGGGAAPAAASATALDGLRDLKEMRDLITDFMPAASSAPVAPAGAGWWVIIPQVLPMLPALLASLRQSFATSGNGAPAGVVNGRMVPAAAVPSFVPNSSSTSSPSAGMAMPPDDSARVELPPEIAMLPPEVQKMFTPEVFAGLNRILPLAVSRYMAGVSGDDFAYAVRVLEGRDIFRVFDALGSDGIRSAFAMIPDPVFQGAVASDPARLAKWIDDFVSFDPSEGGS